MKKTLCVLAVMVISLSVFFYTPVNADTVDVQFDTYKYDVYLDDYIKCFIACQALYPVAQAENPYVGNTTSGQAITTWKMIVSVALTNLTSKTRRIPSGGLSAEIKLNSYSIQGYDYNFNALVGIENFGSDFYMTNYRNNGIFDFYPSTDFGFKEGMVIPANCTLTAISVLEFPCIDVRGDLHHATLNSVKITVAGSSETDFCPPGSHLDIIESLQLVGNTLHTDLTDLINIMASNTTTSGVSADSNSLKTQSDSVHSQEASYYAQNSQAIQATGLSNYQFDASAVSGLTGVRGDFLDVWNALGGWNAVYIFSLTLGLALTILRHSPSAISSALRRRRQNGE